MDKAGNIALLKENIDAHRREARSYERSRIYHESRAKEYEAKLEELSKHHRCDEHGLLCEEDYRGLLFLTVRDETVVVIYCPICGKRAGE